MSEEFEIVELEYSEEDILYYLEDEDGNEVGFVIAEDGCEVECYYEEYDGVQFEVVDEEPAAASTGKSAGTGTGAAAKTAAASEEPVEHGYLYKMASIAGHEGNKARKKAEAKLDVVRDVAGTQAKKAAQTASAEIKKAKGKADEADLGITREDITEMTDDLNAIAKEGAATAKELKEAYDDIMDSFGFLVPKKVKRRLP